VVKLLSEVEVYVKYGLHPKALDHLKKIFAIDPDNPDALERAREVHLAAGDAASAASAGARLVRSLHARGADERARDELLRLREIAPDYEAIHELAELVGGERTDEVSLDTADVEELTLATDAAVEIAGEDDLALAVAGGEGEEVVEDEEAVGAGPGVESLRARAVEPEHDLAMEAAAAGLEGDEEIVDDELPPPAPAPRVAPRPAPKPAPKPAPPAAKPLAPAAKPAVPKPAAPAAAAAKPAPAGKAALAAKAALARPPPKPPPPPEPEEEELDLSEDLEEAEFFLQQGLLDEAREKLEGLSQFYPDHAGVKARLAELERRSKPAAPPKAARETPTLIAPAGLDDSFDIARDLADELASEGGSVGAEVGEGEDFQFSVEDVFNQFKKGVEQTVGKEDSETHFDLGIAYKEMGLLDAAIEEFETAAKGNNRKKEVDCFSMIGLCRVAQGDTKGAILAFRRALSSSFLNKDAAKALHFEIGAAYDAAGATDHALFFFQKLSKVDPAYREVAAKVASLGGGPGKVPPEFAAAARAPAKPGAPPPAAKAAPKPGARPATSSRPPGPATTPVPGSKKNIGYL
jgi:tetratricopeptide (TPR) repeat protein